MIGRRSGQIACAIVISSLLLTLSLLTQPAAAKSELNQVSFSGIGTVTCPNDTTHTESVRLFATEGGQGDLGHVNVGAPPEPGDKLIFLTSVKITDNKFKLDGVEVIDLLCETGASVANPIPATITGKCGTDSRVKIEVDSGETIEAVGEAVCSPAFIPT